MRASKKFLNFYEKCVQKALDFPRATVAGVMGIFCSAFFWCRLSAFPFSPDRRGPVHHQHEGSYRGPRLEITNEYVKKVEDIVREVVPAKDLSTIVSNIGVFPDLSALFTPNSAMHTAFVKWASPRSIRGSSFHYMAQVRARSRKQMPELRTYFQSGGLVDSVLKSGRARPIDVAGQRLNLAAVNNITLDLSRQFKAIHGVSDVYVPQDMDYPGLQMNVNRARASELGLSPQEVIDNVITALTSDVMIAPSYWVDSRSGNNYFVTVQYPENQVKSIEDLKTMPCAPRI